MWIKLISFSISLSQFLFTFNQNKDSINYILFEQLNYFGLTWLIEVIHQNSQKIKTKLNFIDKERNLVVVFNSDILWFYLNKFCIGIFQDEDNHEIDLKQEVLGRFNYFILELSLKVGDHLLELELCHFVLLVHSLFILAIMSINF